MSALLNEALTWAIESMDAMVEAHSGPSYAPAEETEYVRDLKKKIKRLQAYQRKRWGERSDPLEGAKKINIFDASFGPERKFKP